MNFLQKLAINALSRALPKNLYAGLYQYFGMGNVVWLDDNNEAYLLDGFGGNPDVFAIVDRIIKLGAVIPWKVQENQGGKMVDMPEHELQLLWESPNPQQAQSEFMASLIGFFCLTGNAYIYAPFLEFGNNAGKTKELWSLPSQLIEIVFGDKESPVGGYRLSYSPNDITKPENVCHIKSFNPFYGNGFELYGLSPLRAGRKLVTLGNSALTANVKSFDNMGASGILGRESGTGDSEFTEEQADRLEEKWQRKYSGPENFRKIVMTGATIKWTQLGLSPIDLNILQREKYNMGQLCNLWGMPLPIFNNMEASTDNNYEMALKQAYLHAVLPVLYAIRDKINPWIAKKYGKNLWLTPDISGIEVLQSNRKELTEWLSKAFWIPVMEKQRIMGVTEDAALKDVYCDPMGNRLSFEEISDTPQAVADAAKKLEKEGISDY